MRIVASCSSRFDAATAREAIRSRLGSLPRRLGPFAELALAGLLMLELPPAAASLGLILGTACGPKAETLSVLAELERGEPVMPIGFIQSQPGITLAALANHLPGIQRASGLISGGSLLPRAEALAARWLAGGLDAVLIGFVECGEPGVSDWSLWMPEPGLAV